MARLMRPITDAITLLTSNAQCVACRSPMTEPSSLLEIQP